MKDNNKHDLSTIGLTFILLAIFMFQVLDRLIQSPQNFWIYAPTILMVLGVVFVRLGLE